MEKAKEIDVKTTVPTALVRDESETLKMNFFKTKNTTKSEIDETNDLPKTSFSDSVDNQKEPKDDTPAEKNESEKRDFKLPQELPINSKSLFSVPKLPSIKNVHNEEVKVSNSKLSPGNNASKVFKVPEEKRKLSALDEIITMEEKKREKNNRKDYWLHKVSFETEINTVKIKIVFFNSF